MASTTAVFPCLVLERPRACRSSLFPQNHLGESSGNVGKPGILCIGEVPNLFVKMLIFPPCSGVTLAGCQVPTQSLYHSLSQWDRAQNKMEQNQQGELRQFYYSKRNKQRFVRAAPKENKKSVSPSHQQRCSDTSWEAGIQPT